MRVWVALLATLLLAVPATAQEPSMTDEAGDHEVKWAGVDSPLDSHSELDLVSGTFLEHRDGFEARLGFTSLQRDSSTGGFIGGDFARLAFEYEGKGYGVDFYPYRDLDDQVQGFAYLVEYDAGRDEYSLMEFLELEVAPETNELSASFPRDLIHGADGAPVTKDGVFSAFWAFAERDMKLFADAIPVPAVENSYDRMPDEGFAPFEHIVEYGLPQSGHARLSSDEAFRISNGEATTFLYRLEAENLGDRRDNFRLTAEGAPDDWTVTFPQDHVRVEAGESVEVPVLVTTPFNHEHGAVKSMRVLLTSATDPESVGRLEVGIRYTAVPQPAGHHDRMYVHSGQVRSFSDATPTVLDFQDPPYFNTVEDYEHDSGVAIEPRHFRCTSDGLEYVFAIDLVPGIGMGLDFDLERTGVLEGTLRAQVPTTGMSAYGELYYLRGGQTDEANRILLASLSKTDPVAMNPDETQDISLTITPTPEADYVPHVPGSVLRLELAVQDRPVSGSASPCSFVTGQEPLLEPGAWFRLPLDEYHDDVDEYFSTLSGVDLYMRSQQTRMVNPGATALFNVTLENIGQERGKYTLELTGNNIDWARVLGDETVSLPGGASRQVALAVSPPDDAFDGATADITLHATSVDDENVRSLIRMVAEVDTEAEHADETEAALRLDNSLRSKESPFLPSATLLAIAGVLAALRRSRP